MSDYGDSRVRIYNGFGFPLAELDVPFLATWSMNEQGTGEFNISARFDAKARRDLLLPGNLVTFEHARLGKWGGVIVPHDGMDWLGTGELTVRMRDAMFQFARRRAPLFNYEDQRLGLNGPMAQVVSRLVAYANTEEDARLRDGNLQDNGRTGGTLLNDMMISDLIAKAAKRTRAYIYTEPSFDETNLLIFNVNMVPLIELAGSDYYTLQEDINLETPSGMFYREDGELANDLIVRNDAEEDGKLVRLKREDLSSIRLYYRWQGVRYHSIEEEGAMKLLADRDIVESASLKRKVALTAIESPESPDTFAHLRVGRRVRVILHSVGFYYAETGVDLTAQIVSMEYDSEERRCALIVEVDA